MRWGRRFRFTVRTPLGSNQVGKRINAVAVSGLGFAQAAPFGYLFVGWVNGDRFELVPLVASGRGRRRPGMMRYRGRIKVRGPGDTRITVVARPRGEAAAASAFGLGLFLLMSTTLKHGYGATFFWVWTALVAVSGLAPLILGSGTKDVRDALERLLRDP